MLFYNTVALWKGPCVKKSDENIILNKSLDIKKTLEVLAQIRIFCVTPKSVSINQCSMWCLLILHQSNIITVSPSLILQTEWVS